jgi:hypothetical protein
MIIRQNLQFKGQKNKITLEVMFDSGASHSFIDYNVAESIAIILPIEPYESNAQSADQNHLIEICGVVSLSFELNNVMMRDEFYVVKSLSEKVLIGAATLQKYKIKLDFEHDQVIVNPQVGKIQVM